MCDFLVTWTRKKDHNSLLIGSKIALVIEPMNRKIALKPRKILKSLNQSKLSETEITTKFSSIAQNLVADEISP